MLTFQVRRLADHDEVHQNEVHWSARGHFTLQLFHRSSPVVRGEENGVGKRTHLLVLDQPRHHLDIQRRVILQAQQYIRTYIYKYELRPVSLNVHTTISRRRGRGLSHCSMVSISSSSAGFKGFSTNKKQNQPTKFILTIYLARCASSPLRSLWSTISARGPTSECSVAQAW